MKQFESGKIVQFKPYSKLPNLSNDISFFIIDRYVQRIIHDNIHDYEDENNNEGKSVERLHWIEENDFYEIVRDVGGNWVENVKIMDAFFHKKKNQHSRTFTITFSPNDPSMKDPTQFRDLVLTIQENIRQGVATKLHVTLR
jgi:phenylalanyl-tRNA synthetase alpha chain